MAPSDGNGELHRALRQLPAPRAPGTLLPRVMAAIAARQAAARSWFAWPIAWRVASVAALALLTAGAAAFWPVLEALTTAASTAPPLAAASGRVEGAAVVLDAALSAASVIWSTLVQPVAGYLLVWIGVMAAASAAFATAVGRIALGGASHS
jgi:hypothetical protein